MRRGDPGFVLIDVRSPQLYAQRHLPGAINLPHGKMTATRMADWPAGTLFVVYCAGPHCNGTDQRGAERLGAARVAREGDDRRHDRLGPTRDSPSWPVPEPGAVAA